MSLLVAPLAAAAQAGGMYHSIRAAALVDQGGATLDPKRFAGRILLVQFMFTQCASVCPIQTRSLVELRKSLPTDVERRVHFLSISLDSLTDTPATLHAYGRRFGIEGSRWTLATGRPDAVERLSTSLQLFRAATAPFKLDEHLTDLWLIDGSGQVRQRYGGLQPDVARLRREIVQLDSLAPAPELPPSAAALAPARSSNERSRTAHSYQQ